MYARPGLLLASAATIGALGAAAPAYAQNAPDQELSAAHAPGMHPPGWRPPYGGPAYPAPPPFVGGRPVNLGLMCFGEGSRPRLAADYGWSWNDRTERYDYGDHTALARQDFDTSLTIQLWDGGGRIRLPYRLVPPLSSGGVNGWWSLNDLRTGPDMIRASYRLNGINKPQLMIDRRSGRITVTGLGTYNFRGDCDQIGPPNRKF